MGQIDSTIVVLLCVHKTCHNLVKCPFILFQSKSTCDLKFINELINELFLTL